MTDGREDEKPKTVLLLGAGALAGSALRLPRMKGFFGEDVAKIEGLQPFLQWFYPNVPRDAYNLEDVLSYLDLSQARACGDARGTLVESLGLPSGRACARCQSSSVRGRS
jgi:hypothetical protein